MTAEPGRQSEHRIVVGVDGSGSSREALAWAVNQAQLTGAVVEAVTAWEYPYYATRFPVLLPEVDFGQLATKIVTEAIAQIAADTGAATIRYRVVEGNPARVLVDASAGADLLVVGSRGHGGFVEALLGSIGQHCVHHATCPVVVIRGSAPRGQQSEHRIVTGVDGSDSSKEALAWAVKQARLTGAVLEAVTAWEYPYATRYPALLPEVDFAELATKIVTEAIAEISADAGAIGYRVVHGNPARGLVDASAGADLLVVGSRGHGGFVEALLGSTGQHCVHHATCPVVVIRG